MGTCWLATRVEVYFGYLEGPERAAIIMSVTFAAGFHPQIRRADPSCGSFALGTASVAHF
jgi:hypothetical protein